MAVDFDPDWDEWLRGKRKQPYTDDEVREFWEGHDKRVEVALDYEQRDAEMMKEYRRKRREKAMKAKSSDQKGENEAFEPGAWQPGSKKR